MKVSIFGLGYVGSISAACLAEQGHEVIGVDISARKVDLINQGRTSLMEQGLTELIARNVAAGRLQATPSAEEAIQQTEISLICVGTPGNDNDSLDLTAVKQVSQQIGAVLGRQEQSGHTVILRSTVLPGTTEEVVRPLLEKASGGKMGRDFRLVYNPEFLREGSAVEDFYYPPYILIGSSDQQAAEAVINLYSGIKASIRLTSLEVAEMIKYANNAFHAMKVTFAHKIGAFCKVQGIDSYAAMNLFCLGDPVNLPSYYLTPGYSPGSSYLPKDLKTVLGRTRGIKPR